MRLDTYKLDTMPVIEYYKALGKVAQVGLLVQNLPCPSSLYLDRFF